MTSSLIFTNRNFRMSHLGKESSTPDLLDGLILQNNLQFKVGEEDELFNGYGTIDNTYPYRQYSAYTRELAEVEMPVAVLSNDHLEAVFLPQLGGRLWSLTDKHRHRNLLFTNPVIRFCNLASLNAWFSGGVEWNIGIIGHSPFTTKPLFTATTTLDDGTPVLRMYEYERIRNVTYQMDFWLGENDRFLNARMRISNTTDHVIPMYWWSNIAVSSQANARVVAPADDAYTSSNGLVYKVDLPLVDGIDISHYSEIPSSVDYFFNIPENQPKYVAHLENDGYGLLHYSTNRLRSRKLFSWGHKPASMHWQQFLSDGEHGQYLEIQAGLPKTQYGCIPMPPQTAWEWIEKYGSTDICESPMNHSFNELKTLMTKRVEDDSEYQDLNQQLHKTKSMALRPAKVISRGSGFGDLENDTRRHTEQHALSPNLDFTISAVNDDGLNRWHTLLNEGHLPEPEPGVAPDAFMNNDAIHEQLKQASKNPQTDNWYIRYHLGLYAYMQHNYNEAAKELNASLALRESPWAHHALACNALKRNSESEAGQHAKLALQTIQALRHEADTDIPFTRDCIAILNITKSYKTISEIYPHLSAALQNDGRIQLAYIQSLEAQGDAEKAYQLLTAHGGLQIADIREGETTLEQVWADIQHDLGRNESIPYQFDFHAA